MKHGSDKKKMAKGLADKARKGSYSKPKKKGY